MAIATEVRSTAVRRNTFSGRNLPVGQQPSEKRRAEPPAQPLARPKQDEVPILQKIYRAFWEGKLPRERIEEECGRIRDLFGG